jgi:hypothetical protein
VRLYHARKQLTYNLDETLCYDGDDTREQSTLRPSPIRRAPSTRARRTSSWTSSLESAHHTISFAHTWIDSHDAGCKRHFHDRLHSLFCAPFLLNVRQDDEFLRIAFLLPTIKRRVGCFARFANLGSCHGVFDGNSLF